MQKLRDDGGSGLVTIPKKYLERDDVLDDDGDVPDEQRLTVDRLGRRAYLVRLTDGGSLPELHECEAVRRVAAERMLTEDAYGGRGRAD